MAVIINELEVVLEATAVPVGVAPATPSPQASQQMQPLDLTDVRAREARNRWRLFAH
jgi:hypothetical protein